MLQTPWSSSMELVLHNSKMEVFLIEISVAPRFAVKNIICHFFQIDFNSTLCAYSLKT